jgi:hypothetical protein
MMSERIKSIHLPLFLPILFTLILVCAYLPVTAQEEHKDQKDEKAQEEKVREYVEVINTEVIVRAFHKGKPVGGLTEADFILFENGKKQRLTSVVEIRRKIAAASTGSVDTDTAAQESADTPAPDRKRFFFMYFRITDPLTPYDEALDQFFKQVYRSGDYVLMLVGNKVFKITREQDIALTLPAVKREIDGKARLAKMETDRMLQRVQHAVRTFENLLKQIEARHGSERPTDAGRKKYFFENLKRDYQALWDEYKYDHIHLDTARLKAIAASLKTVKFEKWGLVFYQHDTFPQLNPESIFVEKHSSVINIRELRRMIARFSMEMKKPKALLPAMGEVRQAFIDSNTTFHLLLCQPKKMGETVSQYLTIERIHSDRQEAFRSISAATGGEVIDKNDLRQSLARVAEKEDIYYRLTYAPRMHGPTTRKIEVKTAGKKLEFLYNREITLKRANEIAIENFAFSHPTLDFTLKNYQQLFNGDRLSGEVEVKVTIIDKTGHMSTVNRSFTPDDVGLMVSLKLNFPSGGKYSLIVEALDKQTGQAATISKKIEVPKIPGEIDSNTAVLVTETHKKTGGIDEKINLETLLHRASKYCRKLSKATFYFTCTEEIIDSYILKGKQVKEDVYTCDYQIVMGADGKMSERRTSVKRKGDEIKGKKKRKKGRKKKRPDKDLIITSFFSNYPFLLPVTLLGRENQEDYKYQLLGKEKINNRDTYKISVDPKYDEPNIINHGVVWVDAADGSVVKIELNPRALRGIDALQGRARRKGTYLKVTDIHWYDVKEKGIRFPSGTEINETYIARQMPTGPTDEPLKYKKLEEAKTVFSYKQYRFFNVNVNVIDTGHN